MKNYTLSFIALVVTILAFLPSVSAQQAGQLPTISIFRNNGWDWGIGQQVQVYDSDTLGAFQFQGMTPSGEYGLGARILSYVNGTVNETTVPANLIFMTGEPAPQMRMTITNGGNVGVNTYVPQQLFTVSEATEPVIRFDRADAGLWDYELFNSTDGKLFFRGGADAVGTDLFNRMVLTGPGYLGLGTDDPAQFMTLSNSAPVIRFEDADGAEEDYELILDGGSLTFRGGADNTGTDLNDYMTLTSLGRLGLGTTTPDQLFTISDEEPVVRFEETDADDYELFMNDGDLFFRGGADGTGGALTPRMVLTGSGRLGVGVTDPEQLLTIGGLDPFFRIDNFGGEDVEFFVPNSGDLYILNGAEGTGPDLTANFNFTSEGNLGIGTTQVPANLTVRDSDNTPVVRWDRDDFGAEVDFEIELGNDNHTRFLGGASGNTADLNTQMILKEDGRVAIGTENTPDDAGGVPIDHYRLYVAGGILSDEVRVRTGWADYVFDEAYELKSLYQVESHIQEKGHLPNMPAAEQVEAGGIEVGDITVKQQEKIEELFLYMIEMRKEIDALKAENQQLKQELKASK
jgi:hypothetical protein